MHVKPDYSRCVCRKLAQNIKYNFEFAYNNPFNFSKTRNQSQSLEI